MKKPMLLVFILTFTGWTLPSLAGTVRTVCVSPIPGDPIASGTALMNALAAIPSPSNNNRWLLKIEPGHYDLQGFRLIMRPWVDIEGSGTHMTKIIGQGRSTLLDGTVIGADNCEIRELTVTNRGANTYNYSVGILLYDVSTVVRKVEVRAKNALLENHGIYIFGDVSPEVWDTTVEATAGQIARGISFIGNTAGFAQGDLRIEQCRVQTISATTTNQAVYVKFGRMAILRSTLEAEGTNSQAAYLDTWVMVDVDFSILSGDVNSLKYETNEFGAPPAQIGATRLEGPVFDSLGTKVRCAGTYDGNAIFYPNSCP